MLRMKLGQALLIEDHRRLFRVVATAAFLNLLSGLLFILLVDHPVFDDKYNLPEAQRYAAEGISRDSIYRQTVSPGPSSFIWIAEAINLFPGRDLEMARLAVAASWVLLAAGVLFLSSRSGDPGLWYVSFLCTLVFPHAATATAVVLTEGPALLFCILGALIWTQAQQSRLVSISSALQCVLGGLFLGLSITCRQYYLTVLPAMMAVVFLEIRSRARVQDWRRIGTSVVSIFAAVLPVAVLYEIWKGLSSPASMGIWRTTVRFNATRPVVALFYVLLYLLPLTIIWVGRLRRKQFAIAAVSGIASAIALTPFRSMILQPGPLEAILHPALRFPSAHAVAFGCVTALLACNATSVMYVLGAERSKLLVSPLTVFATSCIVFFVIEQAGIGAGPGFFDRYILQIIPFVAIVIFSARPELSRVQIGALAAMWLLSQTMLWRYRFIV